MMKSLVETVVRKLLQPMLACLFGVVLAVVVVRSEERKSRVAHEGERVAYLLPTDKEELHRVVQQHGIIAAASDLPTPMTWYEAKGMCDSLTLRGFSDWSLPEKEELNRLFMVKEVLGGFQNADYWSSSTPHPDRAWSIRFVDGKEDIRPWENRLRVRPIRKF